MPLTQEVTYVTDEKSGSDWHVVLLYLYDILRYHDTSVDFLSNRHMHKSNSPLSRVWGSIFPSPLGGRNIVHYCRIYAIYGAYNGYCCTTCDIIVLLETFATTILRSLYQALSMNPFVCKIEIGIVSCN